jgi:hypothetical protein
LCQHGDDAAAATKCLPNAKHQGNLKAANDAASNIGRPCPFLKDAGAGIMLLWELKNIWVKSFIALL